MPDNNWLNAEELRQLLREYTMPNNPLNDMWNYTVSSGIAASMSKTNINDDLKKEKEDVIKAAQETMNTLEAIFGGTAMLHAKGDKKLSVVYKQLQAALEKLKKKENVF